MPCQREFTAKFFLTLIPLALFFILYSLFFITPTRADLSFDPSPPSCYFNISPSSPQYPNTAIQITVSASDSGGSGVNNISLTNPTSPAPIPSSSTSTSKTYSWTPTSAGSYNISATITDGGGNTGSCSGGTFTISTPPQVPLEPDITRIQSCTNSTLYSPSQALRVTWSQVNPPVNYVVFSLWNYYYFSKPVSSSTTSTLAPDGFTGYYNYYGPMFLIPDQQYYVWLYNGNWGPGKAVSIPSCGATSAPSVTYNKSCVAAPYSGQEFTLSWVNNDAPATWVNIIDKTDPNNWKYYHKQVTTAANQPSSATGPGGFLGFPIAGIPQQNAIIGRQIVMQPGATYYAVVDNGRWSPEAQISIPQCPSCTTGSTNSDGTTPCSSAWSPNTDYTCSLSQTRTCYHNADPAGNCVLASYTATQTVDTCTTHTGYSCAGGTCTTPPSPPVQNSLSAPCPAPGNPASLSWRSSNGADSYHLRVGSTTLDLSTTSYPYSTTPGSTYSSWGVKACRLGVCSSETAGPAFTCAPPAPGGSGPGGSGSPTGSCAAPGTSGDPLAWGSSNGATSYNIRIGPGTQSAVLSPFTFSPLIPGWPYGDTGISSNTWGVTALNSGGSSSETLGSPFFCLPSSSTLNDPTSSLACSGNSLDGTLTWGGDPYYTDPDGSGSQTYQWGFWINVKESSAFNDVDPNDPYYQKWVPCSNPQNRSTCQNTTPVPAGFTFRSNNTNLALNSATTYFYRVFNGNTSTPASLSFSKTCVPPSPNQTGLSATCPSPGTTANVYWNGVTGATYYMARVGSNTTDTRISNPSDPTIPNTTVPTTTNTTYNSWGVEACNTGGCSTEASGSPAIECKPYPAFLKTTGGDVHSNR